MKLTLLGTGTPTPSVKRVSSGYMIEIGNDLILFDLGPGAYHRLLQAGKSPTQVSHAFFSHLHYDHCADMIPLMLTRWDQGSGTVPELKVFGPNPIASMVEGAIGRQGVFAPDLNARVTHQGSIDVMIARGGTPPRLWPEPVVTEITKGQVIRGSAWELTVGIAAHVQPFLECFAFRLDSPEGSICYSGDSGGVCPTLVELARGVDVLIHMNHFYSGTEPSEVYRAACGNHEDVAEVARQAGAKTLVLTHFTQQIDQPGVREHILRQIMKTYDGHVIWGEDLMQVPVKGPSMPKLD